jgi:hypothetical protein
MSFGKNFLRSAALFVALLLVPGLLHAQARVTKHDAFATVGVQTGHINWYATTLGDDDLLSYENKSFIYFRVGNRIYTNHFDPPAVTPPLSMHRLGAGDLTRKGPAGNDTIFYLWKIDGLEFIQRVYAVAVSATKAQIVATWSVRNTTATPVGVGSQFLLDVNVKNDGAKTLTKHGYRQTWAQYGLGQSRNVPPFFINFQNNLPNSPSFNPGLSGQGFFENVRLGLTKPYRITIGDWRTMETIPWGPPAPLPFGDIGDNAILFEWLDAGVANDGKEWKISSMSYGTGDYETCGGKLFALLFYPKQLDYDAAADRYIPNPFQFEAYVFNPDKLTTAANAKLKLEVGPNLTIVGSTDPKSQEKVPDPDYINPEDVTYASWDIRADLHRPCTGPLKSTFLLTAVSSLGPPALIDCEKEIELPCTEQDLLPPVFANEITVSPSEKTFVVTDNREKDKGLNRLTYTVTTGPVANVVVTIPALSPCDKGIPTVSVRQVDSTIRSCVLFSGVDCAGNVSQFEVCINDRQVTPTPDTKQPRFTLIERVGSDDGSECNALRDSLLVRDDSTNDDGLASVTLTPGYPVNNMRLVSAPFSSGASQHRFSVEVIDRFQNGQISVRATDVAGNFADTVFTYCTLPDTLMPVVTVSPLTNYSWIARVDEVRTWDRLINVITITNRQNVTFTPDPLTGAKDQSTFSFTVTINDTLAKANWCMQVDDNAGNKTPVMCQSYDPPKDVYPPVIELTPSVSTNPKRVTVNINDIHYRNNDTLNGRIYHDTGIDSIWFSNVVGMTIGTTARGFTPTVERVLPMFDIWVSDTDNTVDPTACVTIHALDSARLHTSITYCYPINADDKAPIITGTDATDVSLELRVTDDRQLDRGLKIIELINSENFDPYGPVTLDNDKDALVTLRRTNAGRSSVGRLRAMDYWGFASPNQAVKDTHTSYIDVAIWVQAFNLKKSYLIEKSGEFTVPVYLVRNDTFSLDRKGIDQYQFTFDITGDPQVDFARAETQGTLSEGWTVNATPNGRRYTITAQSNGNGVLTQSSATDTVVLNLVFTGAESEETKQADVIMVEESGRVITYNDGATYVVTGRNSTAILPAPQGSITNSKFIVQGSCAPAVRIGESAVKSIIMEPVSPNPIRSSGRVRFATAGGAAVSLNLYNSLGDVVIPMVQENLSEGLYEQEFTVDGLASGTYYLRLESQGKVITRTVKVTK